MAIPHIDSTIEGEIISVQPRRKGERNSILYTCRAQLPNGSLVELPNVAQASFLGGIGNYFRRRATVRDDSEYPELSLKDADLDASIGERVYISFIGGNIYHPIIIGYKQHPNQVAEFDTPSETDPSLVFQYNGLRETITDEGNWRITRKGAPEVKFKPQGVDFSASSDDAFPGDKSPALTPKGPEQRLVMEVLDSALFRVRDPAGGLIEINHAGDKTGVFLSNNDWKSSEDVDNATEPESGGLRFDDNSTDAEYIWLNRKKQHLILNARKVAQIYSFGKRKDVTEGDHSHKVLKNSLWAISENLNVTVGGNSEQKVEKDKKIEVNGDFNTEVVGNYVVESKKDILMSEAVGGTLKMSGGQIALGNPNLPAGATTGAASEVLSILEALLATLVMEAPAGFGAPLVGLPKYLELQLLMTALKGSL